MVPIYSVNKDPAPGLQYSENLLKHFSVMQSGIKISEAVSKDGYHRESIRWVRQFSSVPFPRITSYNVCYTKLLR